MRRLRGWGEELADLILPRRCLGCAAAGLAWCEECQHAAAQIRAHTPDPPPAGFPSTVVAASYAEDVREAIIGYKDRGRRDLAGPLSTLLAASVGGHQLPATTVLIPVPSSAAAARRRGGDHMVRLARRTGRLVDLPVVVGLGARAAGDAVGLDATGRLVSRRRSLYARHGLPDLVSGRTVVLLDDLVTTGASLATAAAVVRHAGAASVLASCVAATERHLVRV